jgi:uncharacterized protein (TIGR03435 family)
MKQMRLGLAFAVVGFLRAQSNPPPRFEVASVKLAVTGKFSQKGGPGTSDPGQIVYTNVDLNGLIFQAYDVRPYQLSLPAWMLETRFDVTAKLPAGATRKDLGLMIRNLLEERFQMKVHHEARETEAYALTVGKSGSKMTAYPMALPEGFSDGMLPRLTGFDKDGFYIAPPGSVMGMMWSADGQTRINMVREPIQQLCAFLARTVQRPVVDQTGLTGRYDAHLRFAVETDVPAQHPPGEDDPAEAAKAGDPAPSLFQAIQSQLGLKLERKKLPVDILVIDSATKTPTEN